MRSPLLLALVLAGCDFLDPLLTSGHSGDDSESGPPAMTSTATSDTTGDPVYTCPTCDSTTEGVFIIPPDPPPSCDVYAQDCPSGFKCSAEGPPPFGSDNITCSPIAPEPDQAGESCQRLVQGHYGPDTCDRGLFCDDADPQTGTGTCAVLCQGSDFNPICPADQVCWGSQLPLCVPHCDPLLQDCPVGESCQYAGVDFICLKVQSLPANQLFEGCGGDWYCAPGLSCVDGDVAAECVIGLDGPGCCSPYCDLSAPSCPGVGQQCRPYYEPGEAPAGLENLGVCALP
ncbi:hypothetical protein [Nannocystis pusilla]|uniref:hypothetical protein n=1 Tax=Nannocystis pusilla TaxID=889268 RepID=UPI003DA470A5